MLLATGARAESAENATVETVLDSLPMGDLQRTVDELSGGAGPGVRGMVEQVARGEAALDADALLEGLLSALGEALASRRGLLVQLLAPALICGILTRFREAFHAEAAAEACHWACYLWVATVVVRECAAQIELSRRAVNGMAEGMQALFPVLLTLLAAVGGASSSAFFRPAVVAASGTMTALTRSVSFTLALAYAVLAVLDNISESFPLSRLLALVKTLSNWTLGVCFTIFIGVMTVQGLGAASVDGVTAMTAKYAIDNFVPIVGGMLADTVDTLVGCSLLVKNALGVTGMLLLSLYLIAPLLRLVATILTLRLCAAALEPVADARAVRVMGDASGALVMLATAQLAIAAMFVLLIAQILVVGNMTVMLR